MVGMVIAVAVGLIVGMWAGSLIYRNNAKRFEMMYAGAVGDLISARQEIMELETKIKELLNKLRDRYWQHVRACSVLTNKG